MKWDKDVDLLVFGGGGAGMTAALVGAVEGLSVLLCEKTGQFGGTTATSGGAIWVPGSSQSRKTSSPDRIEDARTYLDGEVGAHGGAELREAFYAAGPAMLDYLETRTDVRFKANDPYPDYHPDEPGAARGGRTLAPLLFDARVLGKDFDLVRPPIPEFMVFGGMMLGRAEIPLLLKPFRSVKALRTSVEVVGRYLLDRLRYRRGTRLVLGNAMIARLLHSLRKAGARWELNARLVELVREEGAVVGAVIETAEGRQAVRARRGVVLATGGCGASAEWRARLVTDRPIPDTLCFEGATGDGLDAGLKAGGSMDLHHSQPFFWMPASVMRWKDGRQATFPHIRDRPKPGLIAVNAAGNRFVNEGNSYHDFVNAMFETDKQAPTVPAYLICDRGFIRDYGLGVIYPIWQRIRTFLDAGYVVEAPTLAELAHKIGVDGGNLARAVEAHNADSATGTDRAFGKGSTALNRYNGDGENKPNPCLRPIAKAPFFALPVFPAPIGSSAGLRTDIDAQVLDESGAVIRGLYACGNDMSSVMRGYYPGPGITLGPGLTFAFRAAMHAAGKPQPATPAERAEGVPDEDVSDRGRVPA